MEFATNKDNVRDIDSSVRNKWRWDWLDNDLMKQYLRKTKSPGQAFCTICNKTLQYQSGGKKDLNRHMESNPHLQAVKAVKSNYSLEGMLFGSKGSLSEETPTVVVRPVVPVNDRRMNSEAMILGFMAEHDLPYSIAPHLVKLTQTLAKDPKPLTEIKLERCTASYKMKHGVAKHFEDELCNELQDTKFCLNLDESTNVSNEKIVAVLVSYFSAERNEVTVRHLESFKVIKADANSIFMKVEEMFEKYNLPWNNLLSVLLDSCNTMRGKKSGLEARIREKAPHLLDIDGDSVHHVHNAAKAFTTPFKYYLESLFNCLHSDFHWSTDLRNELKLICEILNIKFTVPERFTSHRFLSAYNLAVDTDRLLDAYTIFYTAFLKTGEQKKFQYLYEIILEKRGVSETSKEELLKIRKRLSKKKMTKDGQERKENVLLKLFDERKKTRMLLGVYIASLHSLKEYATLFQSKAPMVHVLHDEQVRLVREFLCYFVKPECIPQSVKNLKLLEFTEDTLLPKRDMFIGSNAQRIVMKSKAKDYMVTEVLESIRTAYVKSGSVLLRKMPIDNEFLQCLSAIDPAARGHSMTLKLLKRLPFHVSHVLSEKEEECYMREIHRYQADPTLPVPKAETRVDHWWACRKDYPMMRKLMLALLTCFHGPMVEGVFNVMGDVMDTKSSSLGVDSLNAIQNVKSALKAKELSSVEYFCREDTLYTPVVPGLTACMRTAGKQRNLELTKKRCEKDQQCEKLGISDKKVVTKKAAQELMSDNIKRARIVFQEKNGN